MVLIAVVRLFMALIARSQDPYAMCQRFFAFLVCIAIVANFDFFMVYLSLWVENQSLHMTSLR